MPQTAFLVFRKADRFVSCLDKIQVTVEPEFIASGARFFVYKDEIGLIRSQEVSIACRSRAFPDINRNSVNHIIWMARVGKFRND